MAVGNRLMSAETKSKIWSLWKSGESISEVGRQVGKHPGSIFTILRTTGGFQPRERKRSKRSLGFDEREEISRGISSGLSIRKIAIQLNRSPSSISREIARNGGRISYRAIVSDKNAWKRAKRPKTCFLANNSKLRHIITKKLILDWSPEQISGWLKRTYPMDLSMQLSHETIYRSLFVQTRGVLKKELCKHLRSGCVMRQSRKRNTNNLPRGGIIDAVPISERPPEIEDRAIPGHWEGDLISGSNNTHIATLVERQSRFTVLVKVAGKDTESVVSALTTEIKKLPDTLQKTLTWDRGMELAKHKQFTVDTGLQVYFCDPQSPWQRGTNENTNRLLRQYFPKKTDLAVYSQSELNKVALKLNRRPRKTLDFLSPADKLNEVLQ